MNSWPTILPLPLVSSRTDTAPRGGQTEMESGRIRKRRLFVDPMKTVEAQWCFLNDQFSSFQSFFEETLGNGSLSFVLAIYGEDKVVSFMGNYASSHASNQITVTGTLQIITNLSQFLALSGQTENPILLSDSEDLVLQSGVTYGG